MNAATRALVAVLATALAWPALCSNALAPSAQLPPSATSSGRELMDAVYASHQQYPHVYEEQALILIDARGNRDTLKLRRYSRTDAAGNTDFLLLFDTPADVRGVAMLAHRDSEGETTQRFYLPAFGADFFRDASQSNGQEENFLGTDYSIGNLIGEVLDNFRHERREDQLLGETAYYVVDVFALPRTEEQRPLRRHYIRQDNLFITRTDHFDELGRLRKRQTQHDVQQVHGSMWRANMIMMESPLKAHRSVIKTERRVLSADYVPEQVFEEQWIVSNQPPVAPELPATEESAGD